MTRYRCSACDYIYDPKIGDIDADIAKETEFKDLPSDWICPICGVGKNDWICPICGVGKNYFDEIIE